MRAQRVARTDSCGGGVSYVNVIIDKHGVCERGVVITSPISRLVAGCGEPSSPRWPGNSDSLGIRSTRGLHVSISMPMCAVLFSQ